MKVLVTAAIVAVISVAQVNAAPWGRSPWQSVETQRRASASAAEAVVRQGMRQLMDFLDQRQKPTASQVAAYLDQKVSPYFDFAYMAKWAAGPRYRNLREAQRVELAERIKQNFLGALAKRLVSYDKQDVRFFRPRRGQKNEVVVSVGLLNPGRYPSKLDFRMYRSGSAWKVFDVAANGSSALAHYRRFFSRMSRRQPGYWGRS